MGRYADFESITRDALGVACRALGMELAQSEAKLLMDGYRQLSPFPEVRGALAARHGRKQAILSNQLKSRSGHAQGRFALFRLRACAIVPSNRQADVTTDCLPSCRAWG